MCQICDRLGIELESPPPEKTEEEIAAEEAAWQEEHQRQIAELLAQGKPHPTAPRKQLRSSPRKKVVVEPAPSHDGAPTFAAYSVPHHVLDADPNTEDGFSDAPSTREPREKYRPRFGMRVYDTTANATAERAALFARRISELVYHVNSCETLEKERIEIVALPLPASTTMEQRAARCIAHNEAERATRLAMPDAAVAASWYIAEDYDGYGTNKAVWVINDLKDSWEESFRKAHEDREQRLGTPRLERHWSDVEEADVGADNIYGHFLAVAYDRTYWDSEDEESEPPTEFFVRQHCLELLGEALADFLGIRGNCTTFYHHVVGEGVLGAELELARAAAAGVEVERPVVIPYTEDGYDSREH